MSGFDLKPQIYLSKYRLVTYPINKLSGNVVNGKTNEVGTSADLVAALQNNMLKVAELEVA